MREKKILKVITLARGQWRRQNAKEKAMETVTHEFRWKEVGF